MATVSSQSEQCSNWKTKGKVTSNRLSFMSAARSCLLFASDIPCKKRKPDHCPSSRKRHLQYRMCPPSHATLARNIPPHVVPCNGKESPQDDLRHQRTVSVEPPMVHALSHKLPAPTQCSNDTDVQLLFPLMESRNFRQHSVLRSDSAFVEVKKSGHKIVSRIRGDFPA